MDNENRKLPPLKFLPDTLERPWGTLEYKLADLGAVDSMAAGGWLGGNTLGDIMQTYLERVGGETAFDWYGTQFPVLVKTLHVTGRTSLHVNPDDRTAAQRYDAFGKTALWYVTGTGPDARLFLGFRRDVTPEEFYRKCLDGSVEDLLNVIRPAVGESFLIQPGTVHAAQDVDLVEIAESSELWFRLHEWKESDREIHLEEAFDLIDFRSFLKEDPVPGKLARTPQFTVTELRLTDPVRIDAAPEDSFSLYVCVNGDARVQVKEGALVENIPLRKGEVILLPADIQEFLLVPVDRDTVLLEVILEQRVAEDEPVQEA